MSGMWLSSELAVRGGAGGTVIPELGVGVSYGPSQDGRWTSKQHQAEKSFKWVWGPLL